MLAITLRHPASLFSFETSSRLIASFLKFYAARYCLSPSFFWRYSSSCLFPSRFRSSFSFHSRSYIQYFLRSFLGGLLELSTILLWCDVLPHLLQSHWSLQPHFRHSRNPFLLHLGYCCIRWNRIAELNCCLSHPLTTCKFDISACKLESIGILWRLVLHLRFRLIRIRFKELVHWLRFILIWVKTYQTISTHSYNL